MSTPRKNPSKPQSARPKGKTAQPISYRCLGTLLGFVLAMCLAVYFAGTRTSGKITLGDRLFLLGSATMTLGIYSLSRQAPRPE